jgi:hypothetical protein
MNFQGEALEENLPMANSKLNALRNPEYKLYLLFLSFMFLIIHTIKVNIEMQAEGPKFPILLDKMSVMYKIVLRSFVVQKLKFL